MLSSRLIQLIEDHAEHVIARIVRQIRQDGTLNQIRSIPESELRETAQDILKNLDKWLVAREEEVGRHYEQLGRELYEQAIPLHEVVRCLHVIKEKMIDFVRDQGIVETTVQIYAEEELEHLVDRFFDHVVYHAVRGYEEALREPARRPVRVFEAAGKSVR